MRLTRLALLLGVTATPLFGQSSTAKRGVTAEDYFSFELVSDPRISPDGSHVVYVVSRVDRAQNRRVPSIWMAPTDGSAPAQVLVDESWSPSAPRWSPDGATVAFISSHAAGDTAGGEGTRDATRAALARGDRRRRAAPGDQRHERRLELHHRRPTVERPRAQSHRSERQVARGQGAERRAALRASVVQVQRQRLVRRQALAPVGRRYRERRRASRSPSATTGTTPTRSGRRTARGSRSCPTAPARSSTEAATRTSGRFRRPAASRSKHRRSDRQLHHESLIGGGAGQSAALVARRRARSRS